MTDSGQSNIVWHSPIKQNKKDDSFIIEGMLRRFFNHSSSKHARIVQFYSTKTDRLIKEIRKQLKMKTLHKVRSKKELVEIYLSQLPEKSIRDYIGNIIAQNHTIARVSIKKSYSLLSSYMVYQRGIS